MSRPLAAAAALAVVGLCAGGARADLAPPPDHPDHFCTPAEQCPDGFMACPYRRSPGELGKPPLPGKVPVGDACRQEAERKGLRYRCRDGGNYAGTGLYCPPGATGSWPGSKRFAASAEPSAAPAPPPASGGASAQPSTAASVSPATTDSTAASGAPTKAPSSGGCACSVVATAGAGSRAWLAAGLPTAALLALAWAAGRRRARTRAPDSTTR